MEPAEYLHALRRYWWVIVITTVVGVVAVLTLAPLGSPEYEATNTLILDTSELATLGVDVSSSDLALGVETLAFLATTGEIPERVGARLGENPDDVADAVEAFGDPMLHTLEITATASSEDDAVSIADASADELVASIAEDNEAARLSAVDAASERRSELEREIDELNLEVAAAGGEGAPGAAGAIAQRDALTRQLSVAFEEIQQLVSLGQATAGLTVVESATAEPVGSTGRVARTLIAGSVGMLLGAGLALLLARFDTRIRTKEDAERAFELPVLAEIPRLAKQHRDHPGLVTAVDPESLPAEAYRNLRSALMGTRPPPTTKVERRQTGGSRVIVVVSPGIAEGKTTTVANLARVYAETGAYTLVLSCDLRRPMVHEYLGVENGDGASEVLAAGPHTPALERVVKATSTPNLRVVTSGASVSNPGEVIANARDLVTESRKLADVVIVDSPPFLTTGDATPLVVSADCVVVCCRAGKTTQAAAKRTTEVLTRLAAPVVGVALIQAPEIPTARGYQYEYYLPRNRPQGADAPPLGEVSAPTPDSSAQPRKFDGDRDQRSSRPGTPRIG